MDQRAGHRRIITSDFQASSMFKLIEMKTQLMIVLCSAAILVSGCATPHSHTAWDYKVVQGDVASDIESRLKQLGSEGWVVASSSSVVTPGNAPETLVILKRRK